MQKTKMSTAPTMATLSQVSQEIPVQAPDVPKASEKTGSAAIPIQRTLVLTPSLRNSGGIQRYTRTLTRALEEIVGSPNVRTIPAGDPRVSPQTGRIKLSVAARLGFAWRALCGVILWQPDLIICCHLSLGPAGWAAKLLMRSPYWIVLYGIEAWCDLPYWKRIALKHADRVIVISAFSREQVMRQHQIRSEQISNLPCTLDDNLLSVNPVENGSHPQLSNKQRVILTVARMDASEQYKGHDIVLRALSSVIGKVPNLTYVIVGDGDDRPRLELLAQKLSVANHVVFTGEISDSELAALYQRSELFILPARTVVGSPNPKGEGFGIVFLEAMAFGKPVVGPRYGAPAEIIRDGQNGLLVDPEDPASVAGALSRLLADPDVGAAMGKAGSNYVRANYSYGAFREKLREALAI
jgi:glycosyltransferase involved in cell wall biosynthesis